MDSSSEDTPNPSSDDGILARKALPVETVDDYLREIGIEPSAFDLDVDVVITSSTTAKRKQEEEAHQRKLAFLRFIVKEASVYVLGCFLVVALVFISAAIMLNKNAAPDTQAWAKSTLTALSTAIAGYVFGKSSSS